MKLRDPIVLRGADVLDGSGTPARRMDILIQGSRILEVDSDLVAPENSREVRLEGCFVSPGWIDLHTHVFGRLWIVFGGPSRDRPTLRCDHPGGRGSSIFDPKTGKPSPEALAARQRGVLFDVGHGSGAFRWETAERACQQFDFWPDTISSDLHEYNRFFPVQDLATTLAKFLHLGLPLERAVAMVTSQVATALGEHGPSGRLERHASAELTIFQVIKGTFSLADATGSVRQARETILPGATNSEKEVSREGAKIRRKSGAFFSGTKSENMMPGSIVKIKNKIYMAMFCSPKKPQSKV